MDAELTANRKNARCPACHRLLAVRSRRPDGSHGIYLDGDWNSRRGAGPLPRSVRMTERARPWTVFTRNWGRLERGLPSRRHAGAGDRISAVDGTSVVCGCREQIRLNFAALDATQEPD